VKRGDSRPLVGKRLGGGETRDRFVREKKNLTKKEGKRKRERESTFVARATSV